MARAIDGAGADSAPRAPRGRGSGHAACALLSSGETHGRGWDGRDHAAGTVHPGAAVDQPGGAGVARPRPPGDAAVPAARGHAGLEGDDRGDERRVVGWHACRGRRPAGALAPGDDRRGAGLCRRAGNPAGWQPRQGAHLFPRRRAGAARRRLCRAVRADRGRHHGVPGLCPGLPQSARSSLSRGAGRLHRRLPGARRGLHAGAARHVRGIGGRQPRGRGAAQAARPGSRPAGRARPVHAGGRPHRIRRYLRHQPGPSTWCCAAACRR